MAKITLKQAAKLLNVTRIRMIQKCKNNDFPHSMCECGNSILVEEEDILNLNHQKHKKRKK